MKISGINFEDFVNYKLPSMYIAFPNCSFKCGEAVCQNSSLHNGKTYNIEVDELYNQYISNPISKAIVCGGLEPFDSQEDLLYLIHSFRIHYKCNDPFVIYTGYTEEELEKGYYSKGARGLNKSIYEFITHEFKNIVIKYGRFIPNDNSHYDEILGVKLASQNQYAKEYNCGNKD